MCQMSIEKLHGNIEQNINQHLNENKMLNEWYCLINENLPKSRRLTPRELAHLFTVFKKRGNFNVEHLGHSYVFHQSA